MSETDTRLRLLVRRSPGQPEQQLGKLLSGRLFQVDVADCADELELMLRGTEPDVVLIDLSTPTPGQSQIVRRGQVTCPAAPCHRFWPQGEPLPTLQFHKARRPRHVPH